MAQTVVLRVGMSCQGCVGAVKRVLTKMEGVESFDVDIQEQKVTVKGNVEPQAVFDKVSKTGKKTAFWEEESKPNEAASADVTAPVTTAASPTDDAKAPSAVPESSPVTAPVDAPAPTSGA